MTLALIIALWAALSLPFCVIVGACLRASALADEGNEETRRQQPEGSRIRNREIRIVHGEQIDARP